MTKLNRLIAAAYHGSVRDVNRFLSEAKGVGPGEKTALMIAAERGYVECVRLLITDEKGMKTLEGLTALMLAASNNHTSVVEALLPEESGRVDSEGRTALMHAVLAGARETVKLLAPIEGGRFQKTGWTALMYAAYWGRHNCVPFLLRELGFRSTKSHKTELEETFPEGVTALMIALNRGHFTVASLLYCAEHKICDSESKKAISYVKEEDMEKYESLSKHFASYNEEIPNDYTSKDITPLMTAVEKLDINGVLATLNHAGRADTEMKTALMRAIELNFEQAIEWLGPIEGGMRTKDEQSTWTYAIENGYLEGASIFSAAYTIQHDDIQFSWKDGEVGGRCYATTPLMIAARFGDIAGVRKYKSFAGICDKKQKTALMFAAAENNSSCVIELLSEEMGRRDENGRSALDHAIDNRASSVIPYLLCERDPEIVKHSNDAPKDSDVPRIAEINQITYSHQENTSMSQKSNSTGILSENSRYYSLLSDLASMCASTSHGSTFYGNERRETKLMKYASDGWGEKVLQRRFLDFGRLDKEGYTALKFALDRADPECVEHLIWEAWVLGFDALSYAKELVEKHGNDSPQKKCLDILSKIKEPTLPKQIEDLKVIGYISQGKYGHLYVCENTKEQRFALKVICYNNYSESYNRLLDTTRKPFLDFECPFILKYCEVFSDEQSGTCYYTTELCMYNLSQMLDMTIISLSDEKIWKYILQISEALAFLHANGYIHGDIRLENVLLDRFGNCKLGGFDFLRNKETTERTQTIHGVQPYMPPELCPMENEDPNSFGAADIWSFGVLIYFLCSKRFLSEGARVGEMKNDIITISDRSQELIELIKRMLACDPKDRPVATEIRKIASQHIH